MLYVQFNINLTLSQTTNLDSSKLKEFADDNFEFEESGRKFSKQVGNTEGKRRNCSSRAIFPFPPLCFQKARTADT